MWAEESPPSMNRDKKQELGTVSSVRPHSPGREQNKTHLCAGAEHCPAPGEALRFCETPLISPSTLSPFAELA